MAREVASERAKLARALKRLPALEVWPSEANFLLIRTPRGPRLVEALRQRGIAVRPCETFPGLDDRYIRVAVRTSKDNTTLLEALEEILAEHHPRR